MIRALCVASLLLTIPTGAFADTLLLRDGRAIVGPRVEPTRGGVIVHFEHGDVHVPADQVLGRYDADDPNEREQLRAHLRHRPWRSRRRVKTPPFAFETTMSEPVFALYRDRLLAYVTALSLDLCVEPPTVDGPTVCLFGTRKDFHEIGGAGQGVCAFYAWQQNEIDAFDDPTLRGRCLRGLQYAAASWVIGRAFPHLPHRHPLHGALVAYYAAAEPKPGDAGAFTFGLVDGMQAEILRRDLAQGEQPVLARLTKGTPTQRVAWSWAAVHLLMQQERRAEGALFARLRGLGADEPPDVATLLGIVSPGSRDLWEQGPRLHVRSLAPTTPVDRVAAGMVAEHDDDLERARSLYEEALAQAPDDLACRAALARFLDAHGAPAEAVRALRAVLELAPLDVDARESLGWALDRASPEGDREVRLALEICAAFAKP